ncbi:hypothetical protein OROGR_030039 [Orobanche gracilis]
MATSAAEEVVRKKPEADQPPLAAVMDTPPVAPPTHEDTKALSMPDEPVARKGSKGSLDRDVALAKLEDDKKYSFVKAWEESEKTKVENKNPRIACVWPQNDFLILKNGFSARESIFKIPEILYDNFFKGAQKKLCKVSAWENSQKASLESQLKKIEEQLEKKKAEYGERMKNKIALIHKQAEEKRAVVEARRGEHVLKAEELAAKYRAKGRYVPNKAFGCFGC